MKTTRQAQCAILASLVFLMSAFTVYAGGKKDSQGTGVAAPEAAHPADAASKAVPVKGKIILSTTTSTQDSGLLGYLLPVFTRETGWEVDTIAVGTGAALKMGQDGEADVLLVHARADEIKFVADGFGVKRYDVMYNDFIIVGPVSPIAYNEERRS
jgi:tungstate transport system substrate-binding protein